MAAARPFPDLAISMDSAQMAQMGGHGIELDRTTSIAYLRDLYNRGSPYTASSLDVGLIPSAEGFTALGKAIVLGTDFYEDPVLRAIPHARPGLHVVAYCPSSMRKAAEDLIAAVPRLRRKICARVIMRFVIYHELAHFFLDPGLQLRGEARFHEAFASYLAIGSVHDDDSREIVEALSVLRQGRDYNYYFILNNLEETKDVLKKALSGRLEEARIDFCRLVAAQPLAGTRDGRLIVQGDIRDWPGFGAWNPLVACAGVVNAVANLRDGIVIASRIRLVEGFFPDSVRIYANEVEKTSETARRCGILELIPKTELDIAAAIRSGADLEALIRACETRHAPPAVVPAVERPYHVCLPCRCGVYVVTEEATVRPDELDLGAVRSATCDRCGVEAKAQGDAIVFLRIGAGGGLDWHTRTGSSVLEERIRATERWLSGAMPNAVLQRLHHCP